MPPPLPYPRPGASVTLRSVDAFPLGVNASVPPRTRAGNCGGLSFVLVPTFLSQPLAHAFHNLRSGFVQSNPRHPCPPVMIDHHTEGFGNVPTDFGA